MTDCSAENDPTEGTYVLSVELRRSADIIVGALGKMHFEPGGYAYVGSAFGPGGFTRLDRHRSVARGEHDVRHWHIDYLLGENGATLVDVHRIPGRDCECALARRVGETRIPRFGASDCQCRSHLGYSTTLRALQQSVADELQRSEA